jgi:hypothetical protein
MRRVWYIAIIALAVSVTAGAQTAKTHQVASQPSSKTANKLDILTGPVNPLELAKTIRPAAKAASSKQAKPGASASAAVPVVSELSALPLSADQSALAFKSKDSKKSPLKDVHGQVDGSLGNAGWQQAGAAAGATSKNGKTSVFVQTNHATAQEPH